LFPGVPEQFLSSKVPWGNLWGYPPHRLGVFHFPGGGREHKVPLTNTEVLKSKPGSSPIKVDDARKLLAAGADPMARRTAEKIARRLAVEDSFSAVEKKWWESWKAARSESHTVYVWRRLEADVFPAIGTRPIAEIEAPELLALMKAIEKRGALDIAKRALQTCSQIFRYAIAHGVAKRNPAVDIRPSDVLASRKKENCARVDGKARAVKVEFCPVRTDELTGSHEGHRHEFDGHACDGAAVVDLNLAQQLGSRWAIPAERMKMKTPHIVPLSTQAVTLLRSLHTLTGHSALLFPGERDHEKSMRNNTILGALDRMGCAGRMTGHGFRGIASTLLHERGWPHEHIELQLAHQQRSQVSASCNHALYLQP
jgi:integrase